MEKEDRESNIIRKLVFRLVKKHIAGSTSSSVLNVVKGLNDKGFKSTVTLLNDHVDDQTKARYNANAYMQFIRQISRLSLDSSVSLRLSQIGYKLDSSTMEKNMQDIINVANSCNYGLWIEKEQDMDNAEAMRVYRKLKPKCGTLGIEMTPGNDADKISKSVSSKDLIKLTSPVRSLPDPKRGPDALKLYKDYLNVLTSRKARVTVLEDDTKLIRRISASSKDYRRNLIFEIPLGYSGRKLRTLQKGKVNLSVYVPYGKDWIPYLINRLAEGRVKRIAIALLNGEKSGVGSNV